MARIQVLELPTKYVGDLSETPFVLILDQVDKIETSSAAGAVRTTVDTFIDGESIKGMTGAAAVIVTSGTLDVA